MALEKCRITWYGTSTEPNKGAMSTRDWEKQVAAVNDWATRTTGKATMTYTKVKSISLVFCTTIIL